MNVPERMLEAMTYRGGRFGMAYRMARASYAYTRSHDGSVINAAGDRISFGRWYAFKGAVSLWWDYLRNPR